nr:MAG TPA: hypothetical protein [Caudoviricetes sp.]
MKKFFIRRFHNINYFQIFQTICSKTTHLGESGLETGLKMSGY